MVVRMVASVAKVNADTVAFGGAERWTGDSSVIRPCGEFDPGHDLNIFVECNDLVFAQRLPVGQGGYFAVIKIGQNVCWIETVLFVIHFTDCAGQVAMIALLHHV